MVFDEKIKTAFDVLRNAATNDFERHRIDVLERDLTSPPVAEQVDETHQSFNGVNYRKIKDGHYSRQASIHADVWRYYHGDIPNNGVRYAVHHDDWNPANNAPDNLVLLTGSEHSKIHSAGLKTPPKKRTFVCDFCGKTFESNTRQTHQNVHYCSPECHYAARRTPVEKTCEYCGKVFVTQVHGTRFCSVSCANKFNHSEKEIRTCPVCGKTFEASKIFHRIYCSPKCGQKAREQNYFETRTCIICGAEFKVRKYHPTRTCSRKCWNELISQSESISKL